MNFKVMYLTPTFINLFLHISELCVLVKSEIGECFNLFFLISGILFRKVDCLCIDSTNIC